MSKFFKKILFWVILAVLILSAILFINRIIDKNKTNQKSPESPSNDNSKPTPTNAENWWLTDEEIEYAYQEIRKELKNNPEIQLVSPSVVRVIQKGGEISEDLKKAKVIFFPINNSANHETADSGSHWTLLVCDNLGKTGTSRHYNSTGSAIPYNAKQLLKNFCHKAGVDQKWLPPKIYDDYKCPKQTNGADCGVYVIAFTRYLAKEYSKKPYEGRLSFKEQDLIFTIAEEKQKLKEAGFPKKGTLGKDYEIGDDVEYLEKEEQLISQWWPKKDNPFHPLRRVVRVAWNLDIEEEGSLYDHSDNFKEFSKKVRLLSGISRIEKEKLNQIYRIKKILKACSLPLEEYKNTKSFNGKDNFREEKTTPEESQFVKDNINKEIVKGIDDLYRVYFPKK